MQKEVDKKMSNESENSPEKLQPQISTPPPTWSDIKKHILSGAIAGSTTSLITCPLDVVKTRMQYLPILREQMMEGNKSGMLYNLTKGRDVAISGTETSKGTSQSQQKPYKGTLISLRRIWSEEGLRGLYRGLGPTLLGYLPTFSIYFPAYHNYKYYLAKWTDRTSNDPIIHLISAIGAGATSSFTTNPFWLIRTRLMTQSEFTPYFYWNSLHAFRSIYQHEGISGLYKGLGPAALGLLHVAVQFPLYEKAKSIQKRNPNDPNEPLQVHQILFASTGSKVIASIATYPHEVLRTRFQNQTTSPPKYRNIPQAVRLIWREEGFKGFYRGMFTTVMRVVPASAVTLITYEKVLELCK